MEGRTVPHAYPMSAEYEFANPTKIFDQNFGEGISPEDLLCPTLYHGYYIRPRINKQTDRGFSEINRNEHKFQVFLDVCHFLPDEISVHTMDNLLEVSAKHPQKIDSHGFVSRSFNRKYILPLDVDPLLVKAKLSHDGILSIEAPRKEVDLKGENNVVKIKVQRSPVAEAKCSREMTKDL
ncbi:heat shock protein beta-2 [Xenopus tropicalis]|uniref:Heat shock protein beta-2 n=1 Tax=Xenopus tropicalis TaxID=8364 RepID=F7AAE2_XENTR|nr:heat shock protein beta-2 [Xenopus tropicalis]|eukprot:XP_002932983.1 PREDICTED: heat shock protein beta-2 [Xenopus tropicalis]